LRKQPGPSKRWGREKELGTSCFILVFLVFCNVMKVLPFLKRGFGRGDGLSRNDQLTPPTDTGDSTVKFLIQQR
jgi:hypothetical protein